MQSLRLEIFADTEPADRAAEPPEPGEAARQQGYEAGYQAGWDEARLAALREADLEAQEVSRALQALDFTFHDARAHVLKGLAPLVGEIVGRLLPQVAAATLPQLVAEAVQPYLDGASEVPVEVMLHPDQRARVERHLATAPALPVRILEAPDQPPGQVTLRLGASETRIDPAAAIAAIEQLLSLYFDPAAHEVRYG